jgi:tetratricopeptide (TPR) repeat protein
MKALLMKNRMIILVCFATTLSGCASNQLAISSNPDGSDIVVVTSNNARQKVAKTPFTLTNREVPSLFKEGTQITIQKEGYRSESFLIPPSSGSTQGHLAAELVQNESAQTTTEVGEAVAQILRLIYKKQYAEAEQSLSSYTVKYSSVSIFWDLLGNVNYLQKNLDRALSAYQTSISLNPKNLETNRMITRIKSMRGISSAGAGE